MIGGGICDAYGEIEENDKNAISHTVTRVKVVKVKNFKETKNQNPVSPISPKTNPLNTQPPFVHPPTSVIPSLTTIVLG